MFIYDISLVPSASGFWYVDSSGAGEMFRSRSEALLHAAKLARTKASCGTSALLNIQGSGGRWRLFTHELKAVQ